MGSRGKDLYVALVDQHLRCICLQVQCVVGVTVFVELVAQSRLGVLRQNI